MQQRGSKYSAHRPSSQRWGGVKRIKLKIYRTWSCCLSNKKESRMQQYGSKYFACRPPSPDSGVRSKGQNSKFSEYGHIAYQIKRNNKCSIMVPNILRADTQPPYHPPPPAPGDEIKIQLFQNMVILHIKLNIITKATTW